MTAPLGHSNYHWGIANRNSVSEVHHKNSFFYQVQKSIEVQKVTAKTPKGRKSELKRQTDRSGKLGCT